MDTTIKTTGTHNIRAVEKCHMYSTFLFLIFYDILRLTNQLVWERSVDVMKKLFKFLMMPHSVLLSQCSATYEVKTLTAIWRPCASFLFSNDLSSKRQIGFSMIRCFMFRFLSKIFLRLAAVYWLFMSHIESNLSERSGRTLRSMKIQLPPPYNCHFVLGYQLLSYEEYIDYCNDTRPH